MTQPSTAQQPETTSNERPVAGHSLSLALLFAGLVAGIGVGNWIGSAAHAESPDASPVYELASVDPSAGSTVAVFEGTHAQQAAELRGDEAAAEASAAALAVLEHEPSLLEPAAREMAAVEANVHFDEVLDDVAEDVAEEDIYEVIDASLLEATPSDSTVEDSFTIVTRGRIERGQSLGRALARQGVGAQTIHTIDREMRKVFDFRKSRAGDRFHLTQDGDGQVLDFRYAQSDEESYTLFWDGTDYVVQKETAELYPQIAKIAGVVDSSFYESVTALGEQTALASEFARIFAWDVDFSRNVHPGDEFSILYERLYRYGVDGEEIYVGPGRVLAGRYRGKVGEVTIVYFEDENGNGSYFRPDGSAIERAFLAAPVAFSRISSTFTRARRHPILKVTRPHPGIDYAAPYGTPVYAVADGVVEYRARAGASGNLVRIRHAGGYSSHYAHLARFHPQLKAGDRVSQKQIIGYVGSTGLSTGPHVCFRVKKNGDWVDPMKISSPAGAPIDETLRDAFRVKRNALLADLDPSLVVSLTDEAL